jgi:hypothetical protein
VLATNAVYVGDWSRFGASIAFCAGLGFWLLRRMLADNTAQRQDQPSPRQAEIQNS